MRNRKDQNPFPAMLFVTANLYCEIIWEPLQNVNDGLRPAECAYYNGQTGIKSPMRRPLTSLLLHPVPPTTGRQNHSKSVPSHPASFLP
ncbi:hypothetical protein D3C73_1557100 [compost metagenome]